tara:strand:+ start:96 stop:998 length:903 start_codon:yes stop_codon:yes gene_type:complete
MIRCPACISNKFETYISIPVDYEYFVKRTKKANILKCLECGSFYQNPWPTKNEAINFYPNDYQDYDDNSNLLLSLIARASFKINAYLFTMKFGKDLKILDYGCGDGNFLSALFNSGVKKVYGYEPHIREDNIALSSGVNIFSSLSYFKQKKIKFDIIRMNHVIEHLINYEEVFKEFKLLMNKDCKIIIQTPNTKTFTSRFFKNYWGALHYPYHTNIFSQNGIDKMSRRFGFILSDAYGSIMPTGWSMSIENILKKLFKINKRGRLPIYGLLVLLGLFISLFEYIISPKKTAVMNYILKRK